MVKELGWWITLKIFIEHVAKFYEERWSLGEQERKWAKKKPITNFSEMRVGGADGGDVLCLRSFLPAHLPLALQKTHCFVLLIDQYFYFFSHFNCICRMNSIKRLLWLRRRELLFVSDISEKHRSLWSRCCKTNVGAALSVTETDPNHCRSQVGNVVEMLFCLHVMFFQIHLCLLPLTEDFYTFVQILEQAKTTSETQAGR